MSIQLRNGLANQTLDRVLEDLLVRFVINAPEEDLSSIERIMFQIEEAQWFYADFVRQLNPDLPPMKMKSFCAKILEKCPLVWQWGDPQEALSKFGKYKSTIPVRGVALFNKELNKVVLVKGTESNTWSFPRGKISKDESDIDCAVREVEEETGFNCRHLINENDCVERNIRGKNYKIYFVKNVPEDTVFETPKYEISQIQWFDIKAIQKKNKTNPNAFFIVGTIFKPMMKWINKNKGIFNEEEVMLQVELKLKDLLGINKPTENVDAGRELLNILQKVGQKEGPPPQQAQPQQQAQQPQQPPVFNVPVPQHLYNQIPFFAGSHAALPFYNQPFFNPMNFVPPHFLPQHHPAYITQQNIQPPNPQTFQKPKTHSKELLSILTTKSDKKKDEDGSKQRKSVEDESIRSRAQELLSVFPKKQPKKPVQEENSYTTPEPRLTPSPVVNQASNEIEASIREQSLPPSSEKEPTPEPQQQQPKIKLLKRTDTTSPPNLVDLLGPKSPPVPAQQQHFDSSATNEILSLLHKKPSEPQEPTNPSNELLNILKKPTTTEPPAKKEEKVLSPSQELLGLLNKPQANPALNILQRKNPELTSTASVNLWGQNTGPLDNSMYDASNRTTVANTIGSPTSDIWATPEKLQAEQQTNSRSSQLLDLLNQNRITSPPEQQQQQQQQHIPETFEDFEDFEDYDNGYQFNDAFLDKTYRNFDIASDEEDVDHLIDPLTTQNQSFPAQHAPDQKQEKKIKILKPGESIFGNGSNEQGKGLLALLNGGRPPQ
ncbi:DCP2 mRNA-decapping enzyme subunit 2 [Candida maltosa Xu316]